MREQDREKGYNLYAVMPTTNYSIFSGRARQNAGHNHI